MTVQKETIQVLFKGRERFGG